MGQLCAHQNMSDVNRAPPEEGSNQATSTSSCEGGSAVQALVLYSRWHCDLWILHRLQAAVMRGFMCREKMKEGKVFLSVMCCGRNEVLNAKSTS